MGFFSKLFTKRDSVAKKLRPVFKEMTRIEEGRKLADQAISYRNVGNFDKALKLLTRALTEFGYDPAIILIGTTVLKKGNVKEAVRWFELQIKEKEKSNNFPLIELYANLGSIYHNNFKDEEKALDLYTKALEAPRPPIYGVDAYSLMENSVYHDMAIVYANLDDTFGARACAKKCDCPMCRKIVENVFIAMDRCGKIVGTVVRDTSGRNSLSVVEDERNSLTWCNAFVFAQLLKTEDRNVFCRWAGLPENDWTSSQIEQCALAMMHYICAVIEPGPRTPVAISNLSKLLERDRLPPLERPLDDGVISVFNRMFGGTVDVGGSDATKNVNVERITRKPRS